MSFQWLPVFELHTEQVWNSRLFIVSNGPFGWRICFGWICNERGFEGGYVMRGDMLRRVAPPLKNGGFVTRCLDGYLRRGIWKVDMMG